MVKAFNCSAKGIVLVELLVAIGILVILATFLVPALRHFQEKSDLNNTAEEIVNILKLAQSRTLASKEDSQYGVYFDISTFPQQYTLFGGGSDYASRDILFDELSKLPRAVEIYQINLGGGSEMVFNRLTGTTSQTGSILLRLVSDVTMTKEIYIESSGKISLTSPAIPSDTNRTRDSRHLHFDYSRAIVISEEKITLKFTFNSSNVTQDIIIADNIQEGQIYWEGEVDVGGEIQKLKIHTHRLNNPDSQFCIHRDRRYNNRALAVTISGDALGALVEYSADGLNTSSISIYVSNLEWQ